MIIIVEAIKKKEHKLCIITDKTLNNHSPRDAFMHVKWIRLRVQSYNVVRWPCGPECLNTNNLVPHGAGSNSVSGKHLDRPEQAIVEQIRHSQRQNLELKSVWAFLSLVLGGPIRAIFGTLSNRKIQWPL